MLFVILPNMFVGTNRYSGLHLDNLYLCKGNYVKHRDEPPYGLSLITRKGMGYGNLFINCSFDYYKRYNDKWITLRTFMHLQYQIL